MLGAYRYIVLIVCTFLANAVFAQNVHRNDVIALGMGNAYIANGYDFNAFLYNPALLSRFDKSFQLEFVNAQVSFSNNFLDTRNFLEDRQQDFINFQENASSSDPELQARSQALVEDVEEEFLNKPTNISLNPGVMLSWQHFAFVAFTDVRYGFVLDFAGIFDPGAQRFEAPSARTRAEQDLVLIAGYGNRLFGRLSVGGTIKFFRRRLVQRRINPVDLDNTLRIARESIGDAKFFSRIGMDLGVTYELADNFTLGAVFYDLNNSDSVADIELLDVRVGLTWKIFRSLVMNADYFDLLDKTDEKRNEEAIFFGELEKLHVGLQLDTLKVSNWSLPLRVGFDGDFLTGGLSIVAPQSGLLGFSLDYAVIDDSRTNELGHFFQAKFRLK